MIEKIVEIIDKKYLEYKDNLPISLFGGLTGLAVYYFYMAKYLNKEEYLNRGNEILNNTILQVNEGLVNPPKVIHSYSYGLAGVAFTFLHLKQNGFIDFDVEENFQALDDFFITASQKDYEKEISDFLHGPIGILYYFAKRTPNDYMHEKIEILVDLFLKYAIDEFDKIKIRNTLLEQDYNEFDFGIAHGQAGCLMVFSELYQNGYKSDKIISVIKKLTNYILSMEEKNMAITDGNSFFPSSVNETYPLKSRENFINYKSRLAWCYGDLSISLALNKAGAATGNSILVNKSIQIAKETTIRRKVKETDVKDIYFCHGASGVGYIYKKFYYSSGIQDFADGCAFWEKICEDQFKLLDPQKIGANEALNFLEGLPGVALTLMESENKSFLSWDSYFLL